MKQIYLFEELLGASGDAENLFAFNGTLEEAQKAELAFHSAGQSMIAFTSIKMFEGFEDLENHLEQKKKANLSEMDKRSPFSWIGNENEEE